MPARSTLRSLRVFYASRWFFPVAYFALTICVLGRVLFGHNGLVACAPHTDAAQQFVYWRAWGFAQMRHGCLALWNPYTFSGCPFLGNWQSGLLYPPNLIYLVLPLARAMNCEIAAHVFLAGLGMALWAQRAGSHRIAALLAGGMVMFGAPFFLHIYAGHLSMIDAMAWEPWMLIAIDGIIDRFEVRWVLLGAGAFGLQVLAGHPQTVFDTLVTLAIYAVVRMIVARAGVRPLLALAAAGIAAALLSSAQLVAGLDAASEGARHGGVTYAFASTFSFAPENFLTYIAPNFFGAPYAGQPYWGRGYLWEMSVYVGVVGFALALCGVFLCRTRRSWTWTAMALTTLWIALAAHTPLFRVLYDHVPGFNLFRAEAKFVFPASLFTAMLAAQGLSLILRQPSRARRPAIAVSIACAGCVLAGLYLMHTYAGEPAEIWYRMLQFEASTGESYRPAAQFQSTSFMALTQTGAGWDLLGAAALLFVLGILLVLAQKRPKLLYLAVLLGMVELTHYAWSSTTTFQIARTRISAGEQQFFAAHPGDYRVLQLATSPDAAIGSAHGDIWGYDPSVMGRYAQFMFFTQGRNPGDASIYLNFTRLDPLLRLARCRYAFVPIGAGQVGVRVLPGTLPHAFVAQNRTTANGRDAIFAKLAAPGFDASRTAVLDHPIAAVPQTGGGGAATVVDDGPNAVRLTVDTSGPALVVLTDPYSRFRRAKALPGSAAGSYSVVPCDYAFTGIPVPAGHTHLRLTYDPTGFWPSLWVMIAAWIAYAAAWIGLGLRARPAPKAEADPARQPS